MTSSTPLYYGYIFMSVFYIQFGKVNNYQCGECGVVFDHCPNGSLRHDNSCYMVSHELASWPLSQVYCEAYGAHLLTIETEREQQFITGMLKNVGAAATDKDHYYWIGGTDAMAEAEWYWAKTVQPVTFTHWNGGNPNNADGSPSHHQDCMAMYGDTGLWDDGYCNTEHNFVWCNRLGCRY